MMRRILFILLGNLLVAVFALLASSMVYAAKSEAYKIKKKDFRKQIETVALVPADAPQWMKMSPELKASIEAQITKLLSRKGFDVLPSDKMQAIRTTMAGQLGSMKTAEGELDIEKQEAVLEHSLRELLFRNPSIDAVLGIRVRFVPAPFENDRAKWHEVTQKVQKSDNSLYDLMTGGKYTGHIGASSLDVSFWDRSNKLLYHNSGGLELVMMRNGKQLNRLPAAQLFQDEKRIKSAIKIAFKPF